MSGTPLARRLGIGGYRVRVAPPEVADTGSPAQGFVPIKNRAAGSSTLPMTPLVSPDDLALLRPAEADRLRKVMEARAGSGKGADHAVELR